MNPTVKEIIREYLEKNSFDGLVHLDSECGCGEDDLMVCDGPCDYPFGIEPSQYERALKVFRICEKLARGKFTDPDIAAYALMLMDVRKDVETSDSDRKEEPKRPECTGYIGDGGPCARRVTPHSDFYYGCPDCEYGGLWQKEQPAKEEPGKPSCYQGDGNSQCHIWVTEEHALAWGCKSCPWGGAWKEGKEGEK